MGSGFSIFDPFDIIPDDFNLLDPFGLFNISFNPLDPMASIEPYKYHIMFVVSLIIGIIIYRKFIMLTPMEKMQKQMAEMQQLRFAQQQQAQFAQGPPQYADQGYY